MKNKNEKGFALILSLVLLLVMSLMGGALIVISSGDHQSNNTSDEYQQTFYVAETALLEGEKNIINRMMGPWVDVATLSMMPATGTTADEATAHNNYVAQLISNAVGGHSRNTDVRDLPANKEDGISGLNRITPCFNSFRNINKDSFLAADHKINLNFGTLIASIFENKAELDSLATEEILENEETHMQRFRYEYFYVNIGSAPYKGTGTSLKKSTTNAQSLGTAYKIYGCGYMMPKNTDADEFDNPDILIPLETVVVLSN